MLFALRLLPCAFCLFCPKVIINCLLFYISIFENKFIVLNIMKKYIPVFIVIIAAYAFASGQAKSDQ